MINLRQMPDKPAAAPTEAEFRHFGEALMQVSKGELAGVVAAEEREKADLPHEKRRGRPRKQQ